MIILNFGLIAWASSSVQKLSKFNSKTTTKIIKIIIIYTLYIRYSCYNKETFPIRDCVLPIRCNKNIFTDIAILQIKVWFWPKDKNYIDTSDNLVENLELIKQGHNEELFFNFLSEHCPPLKKAVFSYKVCF